LGQAPPVISPNHSIGRSDGRCVQRAGTYSTCAVDTHLQGIPGSWWWLQPSVPTTWGIERVALSDDLATHWSSHCSARAAQSI